MKENEFVKLNGHWCQKLNDGTLAPVASKELIEVLEYKTSPEARCKEWHKEKLLSNYLVALITRGSEELRHIYKREILSRMSY